MIYNRLSTESINWALTGSMTLSPFSATIV